MGEPVDQTKAEDLPRTEPDVIDYLKQADRLLTTQDLALLLSIHPKTVYAYVRRRRIPHYKIEANVRFRGPEIAEWLRRRGVGSDEK
jgi:excisionase family DNA binding protein